MKSVLISGTGTEVGKTYTASKLTRHLVHNNHSVQIVKVVETGVSVGNEIDSRIIAQGLECNQVSSHTLCSFEYPMAPFDAAKLENKELSYSKVLNKIEDLSTSSDYRILEGAGGIAVPLDKDPDKDWLRLAIDLKVDLLLLVIKEELGAINQARMVYQYCKKAEAHSIPITLFLNAHETIANELKVSHERTLNACNIHWTRDVEELITMLEK